MTEESVASNGYCPETQGVAMTPDEMMLAADATPGNNTANAAAGNTTRSTLPATGIGGLGIAAITLAALGSGLLLRRDRY
ncbi:MAG: hypothetical protein ACYC5A_05195 [Thermoleophilia bacterium]